MKADTIQCQRCLVWIVIEPLETQNFRAKNCPNCNADFSFTNCELTPREIPDKLAWRGYFEESEL